MKSWPTHAVFGQNLRLMRSRVLMVVHHTDWLDLTRVNICEYNRAKSEITLREQRQV